MISAGVPAASVPSPVPNTTMAPADPIQASRRSAGPPVSSAKARMPVIIA
ncbi:hypothetical protein [Ancylobacter oerskovii]|uniref:Uncharacterized protein n=1 Tax=Ancylobacter oerskovii TaxID=459519 RepID=A0ABW4YWW9_9HYPH|nr:hypothetical protein [Ancylobacter oerskovii]MBS7542373.1 hypothetical protein [Ancylobacter oerskovii]